VRTEFLSRHFGEDVDRSVDNDHYHLNQTTLDRLGVQGSWLTFDGNIQIGPDGKHLFTVNEPLTAQQLHDIGVRVGDSVVAGSELLIAGTIRTPGIILKRTGEMIVDASFSPNGDIRGATGRTATVHVGTITTLPAGSSASVINVGTENDAVFDFNLPQGRTSTISVSSTTTGAPGTAAAVYNDGTPEDAIFRFVIPQGLQGEAVLGFFLIQEDGILYYVATEVINGERQDVFFELDDADGILYLLTNTQPPI